MARLISSTTLLSKRSIIIHSIFCPNGLKFWLFTFLLNDWSQVRLLSGLKNTSVINLSLFLKIPRLVFLWSIVPKMPVQGLGSQNKFLWFLYYDSWDSSRAHITKRLWLQLQQIFGPFPSYLSITLSISQYWVLKQFYQGGAVPQKILFCVAWGEQSLVCTEWAKKLRPQRRGFLSLTRALIDFR